ncbi:MAG: TonB-dependent receptor [Bacteroidia bacterium]|nr:TonB-dependent receptor [Bacteroidia bacterium]
MKKILLFFAPLFLVTAFLAQNNDGAIRIKMIDKSTKEAISFANVVVYRDGVQVGVGTTDIDGEAVVKPLAPGKYSVKGVYVGYKPVEVSNILVGEGKTAYVTLNMNVSEGQSLQEVEIVEYSVPLVDPDTKSGQTVDRESYQNLASKDVNSVAATTAGVYQKDEGGSLNVRGGRTGTTTYFVDGIKIIGSLNLPQQSIEQLNVITGGVPAMYGDLTSGAISVTTRGPQSRFFGGVEAITSQLTDAYGYNLLGFSLGGPLLKSKPDSSGNRRTKLGFFLSGQGTYEKEPNPSFVPIYVLKPEKLKEIKDAPLKKSPSGTGYVRTSEYVRLSDMEKRKTRLNASLRTLSFNGKLDYSPIENSNISAGAFYEYTGAYNASLGNQIFNYENNSYSSNNTFRIYSSYTQKFGKPTTDKEKTQGLFTNSFFRFLVSYETSINKTQDRRHKNKFFNYGYYGKYETPRLERDYAYNYAYEENFNGSPAYLYVSPTPQAIIFTPSTMNPDPTRYTSHLFELNSVTDANGNTSSNLFSLNQIVALGGLRNGDFPQSIYSLYNNFGAMPTSYVRTHFNQFRIATSLSTDILKHAVTIGMEFDQRTFSYHSVLTLALWARARQIVNQHLLELDKDNPQLVSQFSGVIPYYYFDYKYNPEKQTQFSERLLEKLGLPVNYNKWINIDELDPSTFDISMFSAPDLLGNIDGAQLVAYGGFTHDGKKVGGNIDINEFLTKKDEKGRNLYPIGSFKPIYGAAYIMDKFDFKDIKFNVGLRIDYYDANQKVLKDKYAVHDLARVGDVKSLSGLPPGFADKIPSNISKDAAIYVSSNPAKGSSYAITGFREGDKWFDAQGNEISDPRLIAAEDGRPIPLYKDISNYNEKFSAGGFTDYKPAVNFLPRVAFSFPISEEANFFAHYDILTQRPGNTINRLNPVDFLFLESSSSTPFITNGALLPQQTVDYELGYSQILNKRKSAALTITAFYREMRNMIQQKTVVGAYPKSYITYDNIDFGTVKGLSVVFDFRRSGGSQIKANYTLQFAEGSGSNLNSGANLAASGQPNLRVLQPLDFDQRHTIVLSYDYRFGSGKDYKGPQIKKGKNDDKKLNLFENVGFNLTFIIGSGTPYTRWSVPVALNGNSRSNIVGSLNGSRLPWNIRSNLRIDKDVPLTWGKKDERTGEPSRQANLNIYLQVLNLLNNRNVLNVYNFTGNPDDDGYLYSPQAAAAFATANSPDSFRDLYSIRMNNPANYNRPRVIRLGLQLEF